MNYLDIKDIESLDTARRELSSQIEAKKEEVAGHYAMTKESLSPLSILSSSIGSVGRFLPLDSLALAFVRFLLRRKKSATK
ncbi:MAG TPA: hypothetical protein DDX33_05710 [Rikenellaceae bacterium]|nr:hypothetical protein [Rikenellaceae bacterium]HBH21456.1 hypothetical protein [Rikenellaceae bacterium]